MVNFVRAEVQHLLNQASDHSMLWLDLLPHQQRIKSRFIFDCRWSRTKGCDETVQNCWNRAVEGSRMFKFHRKSKIAGKVCLN